MALLSLDTGVRAEVLSFCLPAVVKVVFLVLEWNEVIGKRKGEKVSFGNYNLKTNRQKVK